MNSREKGHKLEKYVAALLQEVDSRCRPTRGSGAGNEISDIVSKYFYVECKKRDTKDITVKKDVWDKLCSEIPIGSIKTPIYILENQAEDKFVLMDIKDFIRMVKELYATER